MQIHFTTQRHAAAAPSKTTYRFSQSAPHGDADYYQNMLTDYLNGKELPELSSGCCPLPSYRSPFESWIKSKNPVKRWMGSLLDWGKQLLQNMAADIQAVFQISAKN